MHTSDCYWPVSVDTTPCAGVDAYVCLTYLITPQLTSGMATEAPSENRLFLAPNLPLASTAIEVLAEAVL